MRPKIFVTRRIPQPGLDLLEDHFEVALNEEDRVLTREEILDGLKGKEALLCLLTDFIDGQMIELATSLRVISNYAVGFNNIDVKAATVRGIPVTNTPGVLTETTADLAWALLLCAARRIVEGDAIMRRGKFRGWGPLFHLGKDVYGKTLGVVGAGRIGTAVARRSTGFNMKVLYTDPDPSPELERIGAKRVSLEELLKKADFVTLHVPLVPGTEHLLGEKELRLMKSDAFLINTSRGSVVHEKALVKALRENWIQGAALDVYEKEPAMAEGLPDLENVILAPHIGSATVETRTRMAVMAAGNAIDVILGKRPQHLVNPEVFGGGLGGDEKNLQKGLQNHFPGLPYSPK